MTYQPDDIPPFELQSDTSQIGERFRSEAELMISLSNLFEQIPTHAKPARIHTTMSFFPHDDDTYAYPESLQMRTMSAGLSDILVTISQHEDGAPTTTIELSDTDGGTIYISRDPSILHTDGSDFDCFFNKGDITSIPRVPDVEIQSLLTSLITHDPTPTTANDTGSIDQLSPSASELEEGLRKAAIQTMTVAEYELSKQRSLQFITTEQGNNLTLSSVTLSYETGSGRDMMLSIDREVNMKGSTSVINFRRCIGEEMMNFEPDDGDFIRAAEIIDEEQRIMEKQRSASEAQVRRLLSQRSLTLFDSDQNSFDAPDASTR